MAITPIAFEHSLVARTELGEIAVALFDGIQPPFEEHRTCVAILICSDDALDALCAGRGSIDKMGDP